MEIGRRFFLIFSAILTLPFVGMIVFYSGGCGGPSTAVETSDTIAPTILSISPADGATKITKSSPPIVITFSEAMDETTLTTETINLSEGTSGTTGTVLVSDDKTQATFTPSGDLAQNTVYTIGLSTGIANVVGNALASASETTFRTKCAASDSFGEDNLNNCFVFNNTTNRTDVVANNDGAAITVENGRLKMAMTTVNTSEQNGLNTIPSLAKEVSGDFSVDITVSQTDDATYGDAAILVVPSMSEGMNNQFGCSSSATKCALIVLNNGSITQVQDAGCAYSGDGPNYTPNQTLRVTRSSTGLSCFYKLSGSNSYVQVGTVQSISALAGNVFVSVEATSESTDGNKVVFFDDLVFNSGTVVDQE